MKKRSPGNGRSSSDQESDLNQEITESASRNHHQMQQQSEPSSPSAIRPKKEKFGFKFLRLFGSTRKLNRNSSGGDLKKGPETVKIQQNLESAQNPSGGSRRSKSCERVKAENSSSSKVDWTTHAR